MHEVDIYHQKEHTLKYRTLKVGSDTSPSTHLLAYRIDSQTQIPPNEFSPAKAGINKSAITGDIYHPDKSITSHARNKNNDRRNTFMITTQIESNTKQKKTQSEPSQTANQYR